ncbi:MAG: ABC transporter permease, partial [Clostridiales bacterium]|nr:ABC transporter permease [Clostridiales bacterium]
MKKTQWIEFFHIIRKTLVTFVAIVLFVTMGMALFFGITWSADAIKASANDYLQKGRLADFDVQYVYGFDGALIESLASVDGVESAEGYYQAYEQFSLDGKRYEVRITSLTENANLPVSIEGTLPRAVGEIAVESYFAKEHGISVGDTIVFIHDGDLESFVISAYKKEPTVFPLNAESAGQDGMRYLTTDTFTVTALVKTGPYLSRFSDMYGISYPDAVPVNALMFAFADSFDKEAFQGFTNIAVTLSGGGTDYFADGNAAREAVQGEIMKMANAFAESKNAEIEEKYKFLSTFGIVDPDEFTAYSPYASTSDDNASVLALRMMMTIFEKLRYSMAGLFVIIGLLVCFFTVSRIVYESSVLIGTKKALGFTEREITRTYLLYAGFAAVIGSVCGALGARFIVEPILLPAINDVYLFDRVIYAFDPLPAALFGLFEIAAQMITVYAACKKIFRKNTLALLHGGEAASSKRRFYEKFRFWKKLSLFFKTIINNFWNDKRRVFATVIGVAACSSLVVCALTLNNHILGSFDRQYDAIYNFDSIVYFDTECDRTEIDEALRARNIPATEVYSTFVSLNTPTGKNIATNLFVLDKDDISHIMNIYDRDAGHAYAGGIWSSCSYAEEFDLKSGDALTFTDENKTAHTVKIDGFFEYYLINNLLVTDTYTYCAEFGADYAPNTLFIALGGYDFDALTSVLSDCEGFLYLSNDHDNAKQSFDGFADVFSIIVTVYLILAVAMAFLVLLNLFVMFVTEKKRELLTLLVNGYGLPDAKRYIWLDTVCLAAVGIFCGTIFGTL